MPVSDATLQRIYLARKAQIEANVPKQRGAAAVISDIGQAAGSFGTAQKELQREYASRAAAAAKEKAERESKALLQAGVLPVEGTQKVAIPKTIYGGETEVPTVGAGVAFKDWQPVQLIEKGRLVTKLYRENPTLPEGYEIAEIGAGVPKPTPPGSPGRGIAQTSANVKELKKSAEEAYRTLAASGYNTLSKFAVSATDNDAPLVESAITKVTAFEDPGVNTTEEIRTISQRLLKESPFAPKHSAVWRKIIQDFAAQKLIDADPTGGLTDPQAQTMAAQLMSSAAPAKEQHDELPPAKNYKGKVATDQTTGKKYRSDGVTWIPE